VNSSSSRKPDDGQLPELGQRYRVGIAPGAGGPDLQGILVRPKITGLAWGCPSVARSSSPHGGRLWAAGASGQGATFQFTLPARVAAHGITPSWSDWWPNLCSLYDGVSHTVSTRQLPRRLVHTRGLVMIVLNLPFVMEIRFKDSLPGTRGKQPRPRFNARPSLH